MDTSSLTELYVVGRPRSGTVWLNRLIADALNSPLEIDNPNAEAATYFGPGRDGGYVVRKAHDGEKRAPTVFIQRDPRDVAISTMFYRDQTDLFPVVHQMCEPYSASYEYHIRMWLDDRKKAEAYTRYEELHKDGVKELRRIIRLLVGKELSIENCLEVYKRQSFAVVKQGDTGGRLTHSMRKGIVGDWRKYFTREIGEYMHQHMGEFMIEEGYVADSHWWEKLNE